MRHGSYGPPAMTPSKDDPGSFNAELRIQGSAIYAIKRAGRIVPAMETEHDAALPMPTDTGIIHGQHNGTALLR